MQKTFTPLFSVKKLILALLLVFAFLLPDASAQWYTYGGTIWNPIVLPYTATSYYYGDVTFINFYYNTNPANPNYYAALLERGDEFLDPAVPQIKILGHTAAQNVQFVNVTPLNPLSKYNPVLSINNPVPIINSPFTSEMAVGLYWGIQYVMNLNTDLYKWKGRDKDGKLAVNASLSTTIDPLYAAKFHPDTKFLEFSVSNGIPYTTLDIIAHEFCHAMLDSTHYGDQNFPPKKLEVTEGLCNVMGIVAKNYYQREHGLPLSWTLMEELKRTINVADLKSSGWPTTYDEKDDKGFYIPYGQPGYDAHKNSGVILNLFRLLSIGGKGTLNDKGVQGTEYNVKPLDPDPYIAMQEAAKFLFNICIAYVPKIKDLPSFGKACYKGAPSCYNQTIPNTISVEEAIYAVGLWPKKYIDNFKMNCPSSEGLFTAPSEYNGEIEIDDQKLQKLIDFLDASDLDDSLNIPSIDTVIFQLSTCAKDLLPKVSTKYKDADGIIEEAIDADRDSIFDLYNNKARSRAAVSVHSAAVETAKYLSSTYGYNGIDGKGGAIRSFIYDVGYATKPIPGNNFNPQDSSFYYELNPNEKPEVCRDVVASAIGHAVAYNILQPPPQSEAASIAAAFGDILGHTIKKRLSPAGAPVSWNIGEDLFIDASYLRSLDDPKSTEGNEQASFYKGEFYDAASTNPYVDAGVLGSWYFLASVGGSGHLDNVPSKPMYAVAGIGEEPAEHILFDAIKASPNDVSFTDLMDIIEQQVTAKFGVDSKELQTVKDAFYAVGLGPSPDAELVSIPKNEATGINPWTAHIQLPIPPAYKDIATRFEIQFTTDPAFQDHTSLKFKAIDIATADADGLSVSCDAQLQPNTTYYCRLIATEFADCHAMDAAICISIQNRLGVGHDVRSFTTDSREVSAYTADVVYPWGAQFTCTTLLDPNADPNNPASPVKNYHVRVFKKDEEKELVDRGFKPVANVSGQTNPDQGPDNIVLLPGQDGMYEYEMYAEGTPDIFGNVENKGAPSTRMPFRTGTPNVLSMMQKNIFPFNPNALNIPWDGVNAKNTESYSVEVYGDEKMKDAIFSTEVSPDKVDQFGVFHQVVDMKVFNTRPQPKPDQEFVFYRVIPLGPALTNDKGTNEGVMNGGDLYSLTVAWSKTMPKPQPEATKTLDANFNAHFEFMPPALVTGSQVKYQVEVAVPDFSSSSNILANNPDVATTAVSTFISAFNLFLPNLVSKYQWRITAVNNGIIGKTSEAASFAIPPAPVTQVMPDGQGVEVNNTEISWENASNTGKFNVALYKGNNPVGNWPANFNYQQGSYSFILPITLEESSQYRVFISPLDANDHIVSNLAGSAIFSTKVKVSTSCTALNLTFNFAQLTNLPLDIIIKNPAGQLFDFKQVVLDGVYDGTSFDFADWGGYCDNAGEVKPGNYIIIVKVYKDPGFVPNCNPYPCGSFSIGAAGSSFKKEVYSSDYYNGKSWDFPVTIH
jgi:Zn-dependent metalloprotease